MVAIFLLTVMTSSVVQVSGLAPFLLLPGPRPCNRVVEVHPVASPEADFMDYLSSLCSPGLQSECPNPGVPGTPGPKHRPDICVSSSPMVSRV